MNNPCNVPFKGAELMNPPLFFCPVRIFAANPTQRKKMLNTFNFYLVSPIYIKGYAVRFFPEHWKILSKECS